jgi:hypothetical protein
MPGPCATRPEIHSIRAAAQQALPADALSGAMSAEVRPVPGRARHACACVLTGHRGPRTEAGQ